MQTLPALFPTDAQTCPAEILLTVVVAKVIERGSGLVQTGASGSQRQAARPMTVSVRLLSMPHPPVIHFFFRQDTDVVVSVNP